jgi:outer membrane protein assembly factor BamE (lipoprotein component of BamABCDE complex)
MRTSTLRLAIVCGILLCTGCLVVPIPGHGVGPSERLVDGHAVKFIEPGKTTREDVLLRLGSPESVTPAEDEFVYTSGYTTGFRLFLIPLCGRGDGKKYTVETWQRVRVEIAFDADSRVRSVRIQEEGQPWRIW